MLRKIKTSRFFNLGTQRALYERVEGYVDKEIAASERAERLRADPSIPGVVRMDLGRNPDGCAPRVLDMLLNGVEGRMILDNIHDYPEPDWRPLTQAIAALHEVPPSWITLSAGLDQMLALISSAFFEMNDRFVSVSPSFFVFNEYSMRMGAIPISIQLSEERNFDWDEDTLREYETAVDKLHPKLVWIANPNNPTGRRIPAGMMERIVRIASENFVFVVVDEAYGEYTDGPGGPDSASSLLADFHNVIVLRTFSKAYGMAGLRIAYAISSEPDFTQALMIHRPYYPITGLSYLSALEAMKDLGYLSDVRSRTRERGRSLVEGFARIGDMRYVESDTGIMMIGKERRTAGSLRHLLERKGIFVSPVTGGDPASERYVRITIGRQEDNERLLEALADI